jgi:hypothetical protein
MPDAGIANNLIPAWWWTSFQTVRSTESQESRLSTTYVPVVQDDVRNPASSICTLNLIFKNWRSVYVLDFGRTSSLACDLDDIHECLRMIWPIIFTTPSMSVLGYCRKRAAWAGLWEGGPADIYTYTGTVLCTRCDVRLQYRSPLDDVQLRSTQLNIQARY